MIPFVLIWFSCREAPERHVFVCASSARSRGGPRHLVTAQAAFQCALGKSHRERVVGVEQGRNRTRAIRLDCARRSSPSPQSVNASGVVCGWIAALALNQPEIDSDNVVAFEVATDIYV